MASLRGKLTLGYFIAMTVAMLGFGVALVFVRRLPRIEQLDQRLSRAAEIAAGSLEESRRVLGRLTASDSAASLAATVTAPLVAVLDPLIVVGPAGQPLFFSEEARRLDYQDIEQLMGRLDPLPTARIFGTLRMAGLGEYRYLAMPVPEAGSAIGAILVTLPTQVATVQTSELVQSMLLVAPFLLLGALALGYWLAGTTVRPLSDMTEELEEITDGRTLHRRLVVPGVGDELAQLAATVNGMLARLERSFGSLHRFTADASHELKTPLMVVRVGVERALTHAGTPPEAIEALDAALGQINHMAETVDNLLTLARADEGRATLAVAPFDLRDLVNEAGETAGILGDGAAIEVRIEVPEHPVVVPIDRGRIRQLLMNLVTNAIKYTPQGGKVSLALVDQDATVAIIVGDNGIGISPADLPHIFDRFWRADVSRDRTGERPGTGLGLAITKWIAEAHRGSISVQSRPGRGTVFTVTLPRGGAEAEERVDASGGAAPHG
ncbi:MAG: sensor histidine kinase [Gemmatimonadales bacterium]